MQCTNSTAQDFAHLQHKQRMSERSLFLRHAIVFLLLQKSSPLDSTSTRALVKGAKRRRKEQGNRVSLWRRGGGEKIDTCLPIQHIICIFDTDRTMIWKEDLSPGCVILYLMIDIR